MDAGSKLQASSSMHFQNIFRHSASSILENHLIKSVICLAIKTHTWKCFNWQQRMHIATEVTSDIKLDTFQIRADFSERKMAHQLYILTILLLEMMISKGMKRLEVSWELLQNVWPFLEGCRQFWLIDVKRGNFPELQLCWMERLVGCGRYCQSSLYHLHSIFCNFPSLAFSSSNITMT